MRRGSVGRAGRGSRFHEVDGPGMARPGPPGPTRPAGASPSLSLCRRQAGRSPRGAMAAQPRRPRRPATRIATAAAITRVLATAAGTPVPAVVATARLNAACHSATIAMLRPEARYSWWHLDCPRISHGRSSRSASRRSWPASRVRRAGPEDRHARRGRAVLCAAIAGGASRSRATTGGGGRREHGFTEPDLPGHRDLPG